MPPFSIPAPLVMAAKNAVLLIRQGDIEIWSADIKALRHDSLLEVFEGVLFREEDRKNVCRVAHVLGIDYENGVDPGTPEALIAKQKVFIDFLRRETARGRDALGPVNQAFPDSDFSAEAEASMAYLALRGVDYLFVVGFRNRAGAFEVCAVEPGERNRADRKRMMSFDRMGAC